MNDTVTRLMALADQFAGAYRIYGPQDAPVINARQALQDELQKLFTPLNQRDGCMAGQPLRSGIHIDADAKASMLCQKSKYGIGETK